jgi:hypothetical protein
MLGRSVGVLVAMFVLGLLAYGLWYQRQHPREIVATSTLAVQSRKAGGGTMTLKTREVSVNGIRFSEIELPNGTWIDCQGDCRKAAREAGDEFWEARARDAR